MNKPLFDILTGDPWTFWRRAVAHGEFADHPELTAIEEGKAFGGPTA